METTEGDIKPDPPAGFFSRPHLITAGWALLFAFSGYIFGWVDPYGRRPQEVIVRNIDSLKNFPPSGGITLDGKTQGDLARLQSALEETQEALAGAERARAVAIPDPSDLQPADTDIALQLADSQRALQQAIKLASSVGNTPSIDTSVKEDIALLVPNAVDAPRRPPENRGYTLEDPKGLKNISCPSYHAASGRLRFEFEVAAAVLNFANPLRVSVARIDAPLQQTHLYVAHFQGKAGTNDVELKFQVPSGSYDVTLGYFDSRHIAGDFPPFYGVSCNIDV